MTMYNDRLTEHLYQTMGQYFRPIGTGDWRLNLEALAKVIKERAADRLQEESAKWAEIAQIFERRGEILLAQSTQLGGALTKSFADQEAGKAMAYYDVSYALQREAERLREETR